MSTPLPSRADRPHARREPLLPSSVLAMLVFVLTEIMFFAGLVSAYMIGEGMTPGGWPPAGQPRLPIEQTAINTSALLASGVVLFFAGRALAASRSRASILVLVSILLGGFFVVFQGMEWVALIGEGLTLTYSTHGAFFYLIVGTHGLHAVVALLALGWAFVGLRRGSLARHQLTTVAIFWYFVVGVWPVLYYQVYL